MSRVSCRKMYQILISFGRYVGNVLEIGCIVFTIISSIRSKIMEILFPFKILFSSKSDNLKFYYFLERQRHFWIINLVTTLKIVIFFNIKSVLNFVNNSIFYNYQCNVWWYLLLIICGHLCICSKSKKYFPLTIEHFWAETLFILFPFIN